MVSAQTSKATTPKTAIPIHAVLETIKVYERKFDYELSKQPILVKLEGQTKVPKTRFVLGILVLLLTILIYRSIAMLLCNVAAVTLPFLFSLHAEKVTPRLLNGMLYYAYFSMLLLIEANLPSVTGFIPFYPFFKAAFLAWLFIPKYSGATCLFNSVTKSLCPTTGFCSKLGMADSKSFQLSESMRSALNTPLDAGKN